MERILTTLILAATLLLALAKTEPKVMTVVVEQERADTLSEWQMITLAFVLAESKGDSLAVGSHDDRGLLQLTPIYVAEANRLSGGNYTHDDAFDPARSLEMFAIVQGRYNPDGDIEGAIKAHNPGSGGYAYRQSLELVKRMEAARKAVKGLCGK